MKTIEIVIDLKGQTKVETKGCVGSDCREASAFLEVGLGTRQSETLTAAFHQTQTADHSLRQSN